MKYVVILLIVVVGYYGTSSWLTSQDRLASVNQKSHDNEEKEEPDPPRNFTTKQLRFFDGTKDPSTGNDKPVYLSVNGHVFDVSTGRDFYGPGGPYEKFAGRECGVALAKMSFDEEHLDSVDGCASLNFGEKTQLHEWYEKFKYMRCYPEMGRLIPASALPDPNRLITVDILAQHGGGGGSINSTNSAPSSTMAASSSSPQQQQPIPEGYAAAPILVGAGEKVFDVSFGGLANYGPDGPYHKFAGRDASRALAKMSLDDADIANSDTSDLDDKQLTILKDWVKNFEERKGYPVVGRLKKP